MQNSQNMVFDSGNFHRPRALIRAPKGQIKNKIQLPEEILRKRSDISL